jgi:hypothetical protein
MTDGNRCWTGFGSRRRRYRLGHRGALKVKNSYGISQRAPKGLLNAIWAFDGALGLGANASEPAVLRREQAL